MPVFSQICLEQLFQMITTIVYKHQLGTYSMPVTMTAFDMHVFIMSLWGKFCYYSHFTDEVSETLEGEITYLRSVIGK